MNLKNKFTLLLFVFLLALILILNLTSFNVKNTEIAEFSAQFSTDKLSASASHSEPIIDDNEVVFSKSAQDESCGECHDDFTAFRVDLDMPGTVQPDDSFQYELTVKNSDTSTPHVIENLEAVLTGIDETPKEPYENSIDSSIRRFGTDQHSFPVEPGANNILVTLSGNSGVIGINNIDLHLTSPTGNSWDSTSNGCNEEILLDVDDIETGGTGTYTIEVEFVSGLGQISYSITIDVSYTLTDLVQFGGDLSPGDSYEFKWTLTLTSEELDKLGSEVSGTASYEHPGGDLKSYRYTVEINPGVNQQQSGQSSINSLLENGRLIGFISLGLLVFIIVNGFSSKTRNVIAESLKIKNPQTVHCLFSFSILIFTAIHAVFLISSAYAWNAEPNLYGGFALFIFGGVALTSFYRQKLISKFGKRKWKRLHLILIILFTLIILYHSITFGYHFS
jgi:hypothetical protein